MKMKVMGLFLLSALCGLAMSAGNSWAQMDRPIIMPPPRPIPWPVLNQELQLKSQAAVVDIRGLVAHTKLTQIFQNVTNRRIEGTYVFPLPEGAAVSGFAMTVNGKRMEAEILEGEKARQIYTSIVQRVRDPAILEFIDRNLIQAKIFPIEPGAEQKMELSYTESLRGDNNSYRYVVPLRLPTGGAARSASVDIRITTPGGLRAIYSPTHDIEVKRDGDNASVSGEFSAGGWDRPEPRPIAMGDSDRRIPRDRVDRGGSDRDFVLLFTTAQNRVGVNLITYQPAEEDGYFMMLVAPDPQVSPREIEAKDVVLVMDTSGSMEGEKIEQARKALLSLLGNLNPRDRFNIITFSSDVRTFRDNLVNVTPQSIETARNWVKEIKAVGGTAINDALLEAVKMMKDTSSTDNRPRQIVFMTDGQPTVGETDVAQILKNVRAVNSPHDRDETGKSPLSLTRLFVFGVGFDVNTRLLDTLAADNRGASDYVLPQEDMELKIGSLYSKIAYPVLTNPRVDWGGTKVYDVYPKRLPDLFRGMQTVVFGRYEGQSKAKPQLIGFTQGREDRIATQGDFTSEPKAERAHLNDMVPRLWAMRKIGYLLDESRGASNASSEVRDEIIKLSRRFGIVTPFTAGLITEDNQNLAGPMRDMPALRSDASANERLGLGARDESRRSSGRSGNKAANGGFAGGGFGGGAADVDDLQGATTAGPQGPTGATTAPAPPRLTLPSRLPSSGREAVLSSQERQKLKEGDRVKDEEGVRYVEGKAFFLRNGEWVDGAYDAAKSPKVVEVKFASPEYLALLKDPKVAKWMSIGDKVLIVLKDRTVRIVAEP